MEQYMLRMLGFCLVITSVCTATGGVEEFASRRLWPRHAETYEVPSPNNKWSFPFIHFPRKEADTTEETPSEVGMTSPILVDQPDPWQIILGHFQEELPLTSPSHSTVPKPESVSSFPVPETVSKEEAPIHSISEVSPSPLVSPTESIEELLDEPSAVPSEEELVISPADVDSQPSLVAEPEDVAPLAPSSSPSEDDTTLTIGMLSSASDSEDRVDRTSEASEVKEVKSSVTEAIALEETERQTPAPQGNNHQHHISQSVKIVSWTLAGLCISLVVVGNFLGIYFSYIRPRLYRNTDYYTEL